MVIKLKMGRTRQAGEPSPARLARPSGINLKPSTVALKGTPSPPLIRADAPPTSARVVQLHVAAKAVLLTVRPSPPRAPLGVDKVTSGVVALGGVVVPTGQVTVIGSTLPGQARPRLRPLAPPSALLMASVAGGRDNAPLRLRPVQRVP